MRGSCVVPGTGQAYAHLPSRVPSHLQSPSALTRSGHLMGLKPLVLVIFHSPVNFYRWKIENLEIQMEAVPFRSKGGVRGCQLLGGFSGVWGGLGRSMVWEPERVLGEGVLPQAPLKS